MKKIVLTALIGLMSNFALLPLNAQATNTGDCASGAGRYVIETLPLEPARPVTVDYEPGQRVTLSGDAEGTGKLVGRSVVAVEFAPINKGIGYGVEQDSLPVQDVTPLMITGQNNVSLTAVDVQDSAWLILTGECAAANKLDVTANVIATPTPVQIPTPTSAAIAESAILSQSLTITHTDEMVSANPVGAPMMGEAEAHPLMQRMGRILLATALLGLSLVLTIGKPRQWALWLRERVEQIDWLTVKRALSDGWQWLRRMVRRWMK